MTARQLIAVAAVLTLDGWIGRAEPSEWWSLQPIRDVPPPLVTDGNRPNSPIDRFVLSELQHRGLTPMGPADKRTLLRRATFDLTGLPPTTSEIDSFLNDDSPQAFATVIERLLASPAYGERWGRHWLDVVRYADTAGDNSDYPVPQLYMYRDWVIRAVATDMPYDQFVREQLAGDLMSTSDMAVRRDRLIATGYLANSRRHGSYEDERYPWHLTYEDTIDNLGRALLGVTLACCRCHDHKFDPFTQEDYYALYGFFSSTRYPWAGTELDKAQRDLVPLAASARVDAHERERRARIDQSDTRMKELKKQRANAETAIQEAEKLPDGDDRKKRIAELNRLLDGFKNKIKSVQSDLEKITRQPLPYETAYAVAEGETKGKKKVGNACVQIKGDPAYPGKEVPRRFPTVLGGQTLPAGTNGSGRLHLAEWLTDAKNPLFARVMVNRLWHFHFGRGLVPTPGDFGKQGRPPSHPELLDYLTSRFIASGWSLKSMHRLIMLSDAYRRSSANHRSNLSIDIDNEYLWRYNRHRLDAESIRDALLCVSGTLDRVPGKEHPFPAPTSWNFTQHNPFKAVYNHNKRSVYLMTQRIQRHPFLGLFDGADTNSSTAKRVLSTTPLQALYMLNDPFVHSVTSRFAARLKASERDDQSRVRLGFELLYGRLPDDEELAAVLHHLQVAQEKSGSRDTAWESAVRAMVTSNEFVYVE